MMSFRTLSLLAAVMAMSLTSTPTWAESIPEVNTNTRPQYLLAQYQSPRLKGHRGGEYPKTHFLEKLNLTENQKRQIEAIHKKYQGQIENRRITLYTAHQELHEMMVGISSNTQIRAQHRKISSLREELGDLRFERTLEIRGLLTPEQRAQLGDMVQARRDRLRDRLHNRNHNWQKSGNHNRF